MTGAKMVLYILMAHLRVSVNASKTAADVHKVEPFKTCLLSLLFKPSFVQNIYYLCLQKFLIFFYQILFPSPISEYNKSSYLVRKNGSEIFNFNDTLSVWFVQIQIFTKFGFWNHILAITLLSLDCTNTDRFLQ